MQSRINFLIAIILTVLVSIGFAAYSAEATAKAGQETTTLPEKPVSADDVNAVSMPSFPYVAEITGDDVYIRSGPGTNYYRCGKLNKTDRVKVVSSQFSWSRIIPPTGSFSWISMQYVGIDLNNPAIGTVTGDAVRVYAGSEYREPIHSETPQVKLNRGDKVKLLGEEKDNYYKIVPPAGAYLWVSTKYTKALGEVGEVPLTAAPAVDTGAVVLTKLSVEDEKLKEYYALKKQMQAQQAKPIARQDYTKIRKALLEIAGNKEAGKAARYCQFAIKQIERFELAAEIAEVVQLQNSQLQQAQEQIDKTRAKRLAKVQDLGRFAIIGKLETSSIYGPEAEVKRYRIIDDSGKTVCYVEASGSASEMDLGKFIGRKVGLVGTIEPNPQTAGALVRFTEVEVVELK